jgi:hypothetical protein
MDWMNWKTWTTIGLIIVALFAIYTFAATQSSRATEEVATATRAPARLSRTVNAPGVGSVHKEWLDAPSGTYRSERNLFAYPDPPRVHKEWLDAPSGTYRSERNLFAYREPPPPPPPPRPKPIVVQPLPIVVAPQPPPQPAAPVPPAFPYKYIGTFGRPDNPIATFSGSGEIVNVRVGETIDGKFILRSIGIESVEIGYVGFPPDAKTRVALGQ